MKKTSKIVWILVAVCLGLGVVLAGAGLALGATFGQTDLGLVGRHGNTEILNRDGWHELLKESYTDQITSIDLSAGAGEVIITEGDDFAIEVAGDRKFKRIRSRVEHGVWVIDTDPVRSHFGNRLNRYTMKITLPKDFVAREFSAEIGAGSLTADVLRARKLELEVGAGSMAVDKMEVTGPSDLTAGMGQITLTGSLLGQTEVECGMGQVTMTLDGSKNDYGCVGEVGMGQIVFGDSTASGIASELYWNGESTNQMDISCTMGQVTVDFTK